jgi:hypothetical protein
VEQAFAARRTERNPWRSFILPRRGSGTGRPAVDWLNGVPPGPVKLSPRWGEARNGTRIHGLRVGGLWPRRRSPVATNRGPFRGRRWSHGGFQSGTSDRDTPLERYTRIALRARRGHHRMSTPQYKHAAQASALMRGPFARTARVAVGEPFRTHSNRASCLYGTPQYKHAAQASALRRVPHARLPC